MKNKKKGIITTIILMVIVVAAVAFYYWKVVNKDSADAEKEYVPGETDKILEMDLENNYPATAREVVKLFSRIRIVLTNETLSDEQFESIIVKLRMLYSKELLDNNSLETQIADAKEEAESSRNSEIKITNYQVEMGGSAETWSDNGVDFYSIKVVFSSKEKGKTKRNYEQFLLKNEDGKWKIVGWRDTDGAMMDTY